MTRINDLMIVISVLEIRKCSHTSMNSFPWQSYDGMRSLATMSPVLLIKADLEGIRNAVSVVSGSTAMTNYMLTAATGTSDVISATDGLGIGNSSITLTILH